MNWGVYNFSLVRRGEVLQDFSVLDGAPVCNENHRPLNSIKLMSEIKG